MDSRVEFCIFASIGSIAFYSPLPPLSIPTLLAVSPLPPGILPYRIRFELDSDGANRSRFSSLTSDKRAQVSIPESTKHGKPREDCTVPQGLYAHNKTSEKSEKEKKKTRSMDNSTASLSEWLPPRDPTPLVVVNIQATFPAETYSIPGATSESTFPNLYSRRPILLLAEYLLQSCLEFFL